MNFNEFKLNFQKKEVREVPNNCVEKPLLSVCIQTFNHKKYIEKCLDGILAQKTDFIFEILLGDDDSSDGTRDICLKYANLYPERIRLFLHHRENNIKISSKPTGIFNFTYNLFSARGTYIAYCDGDDYWVDNYKLQKQVNYLEVNPGVVLTYHAIKMIDHEGSKIPEFSHFQSSQKNLTSENLKRVLVQPPTSTWCFRNCIKEVPIKFTKVLNADNFWLSLLGHYGSGAYLENISPNIYRIHSGSLWNSKNKLSQLKAKFHTYFYLAEYYKRQNSELYLYFLKRSRAIKKSIALIHFKHLRLVSIIKLYTPKPKNLAS